MADNVTLPGTGEPIATDDIGGVQYQRIKLVDAAPDSTAPIGTASNPLPTKELPEASSLLLRIFNLLMSPMGFDRSLSRQRVTAVVESGTVTTVGTVSTVTGVTTVSTVTGLTNIDGRNGTMLINQTNLSAWADCVRARIT